ncbi:MAG: 3-deoxy-manno-octulosonate cytidylyltransferase [Flavobacteriales bacterium]
MKTLIIIPARYGSARFPGKLLADLNGKSVIRRTMERCLEAEKVERLLVATDDERILANVEAGGGEAVLTHGSHRSGTERCAEALERSPFNPDIVVNVQGDEPFISPEQIDRAIDLFEDPEVDIGTLGCAIHEEESFQDPDRVKVVADPKGHCLYFSRSPIPYPRKGNGQERIQHIGLYAYRSSVLSEIAGLDPTPLERSEGLEQLRWLEHGYRIRIAIGQNQHPGIDNPQDLERARARISKGNERNAEDKHGSA